MCCQNEKKRKLKNFKHASVPLIGLLFHLVRDALKTRLKAVATNCSAAYSSATNNFTCPFAVPDFLCCPHVGVWEKGLPCLSVGRAAVIQLW